MIVGQLENTTGFGDDNVGLDEKEEKIYFGSQYYPNSLNFKFHEYLIIRFSKFNEFVRKKM